MSIVRLGSRLGASIPISFGISDSTLGGYAKSVLADSPLAYWPLQETGSPSTFSDISGNNRPLTTLTNITTGVTGIVAAPDNKAITIPSNGSALRAVFNTVYDHAGYEFWYKPSTAVLNAQIFSNDTSGAGGYGLVQKGTGNTHPTVAIWGSGYKTSSTGSTANGTWVHVAVTHEGGLWSYYFNGSLDSTGGFSDPIAVPSGNIVIGGGAAFDVAHFAFYNPAPSAARIAAHYAARNT